MIYGLFYAILCPFVGINVMMSYCSDIASKVLPSLKSIIGALLMLSFWIFSAISIFYVGKYGRKDMTVWGTYGIALTLFAITFGYFLAESSPVTAQMVIFLSMIAFLFAYGMTYAPIMWMWVAEAVQPTKIGYAIMCNWAGAALIMILFPIVQASVSNQGYIFAFFGLFALLSVPITKKFML
jgi:hypothetical protein